jgi:hypothetical protein
VVGSCPTGIGKLFMQAEQNHRTWPVGTFFWFGSFLIWRLRFRVVDFATAIGRLRALVVAAM